jgi:hypothetical protein
MHHQPNENRISSAFSNKAIPAINVNSLDKSGQDLPSRCLPLLADAGFKANSLSRAIGLESFRRDFPSSLPDYLIARLEPLGHENRIRSSTLKVWFK